MGKLVYACIECGREESHFDTLVPPFSILPVIIRFDLVPTCV